MHGSHRKRNREEKGISETTLIIHLHLGVLAPAPPSIGIRGEGEGGRRGSSGLSIKTGRKDMWGSNMRQGTIYPVKEKIEKFVGISSAEGDIDIGTYLGETSDSDKWLEHQGRITVDGEKIGEG